MRLNRGVRTLVWNVAGAAAGVALFTNATLSTPLPQLAKGFAVSLLFSLCISTLCFAVLSRLGPYLMVRVAPATYWAVMIASMLALATLGSLLALALLSATGVIGAGAILRSIRQSL